MVIDLDLCARCGNQFASPQVCDGCVTDADRLRAAAEILRRQAGRQTALLRVFTGVLDRRADRIERG